MANKQLPKKEFKSIFWRSFTLLGSFNYERMEGLGFLYAILPSLKRIYKDDEKCEKSYIIGLIKQKGYSLVPISLYFKGNFVKVSALYFV